MNIRKINSAFIVIFTAILVLSSHSNSQVYTENDSVIFTTKINSIAGKNFANEPIGDVIAAIGKSFVGTGYAVHTLEIDSNECLITNLSSLDCTTFLENSLAIARCIKEKNPTFENFTKELTKIRYRNGIINEYPSRLNYFSDWIYNNKEKGIIQDISENIGGEPIKFQLSYMSLHPGFYPELIRHPEFINSISKQEREISQRNYFFIPKENISSLEDKLHNGDLIAITSGINGLDFNHVGIAVRMDDGRIHLLHAPNIGKKVQITSAPLSDYLAKIKKDTGVIVIRASEPSGKMQ